MKKTKCHFNTLIEIGIMSYILFLVLWNKVTSKTCSVEIVLGSFIHSSSMLLKCTQGQNYPHISKSCYLKIFQIICFVLSKL